MLRLLCLYLILHAQYSFLEASPLIGEDTRLAYLEEFPFIVSIGHKICGDVEDEEIIHSQFCGGSLITANHVLSAAHCFTNQQFNNIVVKIGSVDVLKCDTYGIEWWLTYSQWANISLPQGYDKDLVYDIAILKLRGTVSDIELPTISYTPDTDLYDKSAVTGGWGVTAGNNKPKYMRIADFIIKSPERCEPFITERDPFLKYLLPKLQLCTISARGTSITGGDSGSPLLGDEDNIVGVNIATCVPSMTTSLHAYRNRHSSVNAYKEFIEAVKRK